MSIPDIEKNILQTIDNLQQLKDINSILDTVLLEDRKLARADAGTIFLATQSGLTFNYVQTDTVAVQNDIIASHYRYYTIPIDKTSIVGYCAATGEQVSIDDAYNLPEGVPFSFNSFFDRKTSYRTKSVFVMPLKTLGNTLVGVMELINAMDENRVPISFSPELQRDFSERYSKLYGLLPPMRVYLEFDLGGPISVGRGSYVSEALRQLGLINVLAAQGKVDILASPHIMAANNQEVVSRSVRTCPSRPPSLLP